MTLNEQGNFFIRPHLYCKFSHKHDSGLNIFVPSSISMFTDQRRPFNTHFGRYTKQGEHQPHQKSYSIHKLAKRTVRRKEKVCKVVRDNRLAIVCLICSIKVSQSYNVTDHLYLQLEVRLMCIRTLTTQYCQQLREKGEEESTHTHTHAHTKGQFRKTPKNTLSHHSEPKQCPCQVSLAISR